MQVDAIVIYSLLLASLIFIVFRLIYFDPQNYQQQKIATPAAYLSIAALGAVLGFLAGLVGIGGGIYYYRHYCYFTLPASSKQQPVVVALFYVTQ